MIEPTINDAATIAGDGGAMLAGRYRIVRQLGQGGMGSVWLAEDTLLDNKPFAIKMLPSILVSNKRAYRQLKDEALVAMKLTHPNIVTLRAFEENNGNPFLVMDYINGETLDDYLAEYGDGNLTQRRGEAESQSGGEDGFGYGLPEEEVVRILRPIAAALDYAHSEGVIHRDVKPANVMIRKDGHPFILDFGIAREIQETLTRVTGKLSSGTLLYMSPEQLNGEQPKPAQDIYSFAAMVYECLKGEPPFVRGQIEHQILNVQPEPLVGRVVPNAPHSIAASVMAGLAKKPEDRPANCSGVLKMASSAARVHPQPSVATPSSYPTGKPSAADAPSSYAKRPTQSRIPIASGSHRTGLGMGWKMFWAALLLVVAVVGGVKYHIWHQQQAHEKHEAEEAKKDAGTAKDAAKMIKADEYAVELWRDATNLLELAHGKLASDDYIRAKKYYKDAYEKFKESNRATLGFLQREMEDVWAKAKGIEAVISGVRKDNGFAELLRDFKTKFGEADAFRNANRYEDATIAFSNALEYAEKIIKLDEVRNQAIAELGMAESAKRDADKFESPSICPDDYGRAQKIFNAAYELMRKRDFENAKRSFGSAKDAFASCATEARSEKQRRDECLANKKNAMEKAKSEALAQWERVKDVSDENGFRKRKQAVESKLKDANWLADDSKWDDAARKYVEMKGASDELLRLDKERQEALSSRTEAIEASKEAENAGATKYGVDRWNEVTNGSWKEAEGYLKNGNFRKAKDGFDIAHKGYLACAKRALDKKRELDAAEQLRKEVQEANRKAEERRKAMQSLPGRWTCKTNFKFNDSIYSNTKYEYEFKSNGEFRFVEYRGGDWESVSTETGRWSLNGNRLTVRCSNRKFQYSGGSSSEENCNEIEIYVVLWRGDGSFELRYDENYFVQDRQKRFNSSLGGLGNKVKAFYYDAAGNSHYKYTHAHLFVINSENEFVESPKIFKRMQ